MDIVTLDYFLVLFTGFHASAFLNYLFYCSPSHRLISQHSSQRDLSKMLLFCSNPPTFLL